MASISALKKAEMRVARRVLRMKEVLHDLFKQFPEQIIVGGVVFSIAGPVWLYRVLDYPSNTKPWYRGRYDVVRPDSEVAMQRRPPEDYPANYLSNRRTDSYRKYLKDYGWKANLD
ncbi:hypothetical protein M3Y99_01718500 [Aphelenchoides fujianensis]|nr:hypothetical protein M3Y99_01718500 [Aphelenchoides fujianensis]